MPSSHLVRWSTLGLLASFLWMAGCDGRTEGGPGQGGSSGGSAGGSGGGAVSGSGGGAVGGSGGGAASGSGGGAVSGSGGGAVSGSGGGTVSGSGGGAVSGSGGGAVSGSGGGTVSGSGGGSVVVPPACGGVARKPGVVASSAWVNVKPSVVRGNAILADPAIAGVFYAFIQTGNDNPADSHLLKSTDFGQTWSQQDTMTIAGNAWGAAIDPNPDRCKGKTPCPPPVLLRAAGTAALGLWKSLDDGKTWTNLFAQHTSGTVPTPGGGTVTYPGQKNGPNDVLDFYQVLIAPDDPPNHLLVTYHYGNIVLESKDGGLTWEVHTMIDGTSHYIHAFDAQTWIVMGQQFDAPSATYRTTTGGRIGGVPSKAAWTKVDDTTHCHGGFTPFIDPVDCSFTMAGSDGLKRTTDKGATWTLVLAQNSCTLVGTPNTLHVSTLFNTWGARLDLRAPSSAPATYTFPSPWDGAPPYGAASAYDAAHQQWVMLITQYSGGIWRLTEAQ